MMAADTQRCMKLKKLPKLHRLIARGVSADRLKRFLQKLEDKESINCLDGIGDTPLQRAIACRRRDLALTLLRYGADVQRGERMPAVHMAATKRMWGVVSACVRRGANVDSSRGSLKRTPLHSAICHGAPLVYVIMLTTSHNVNVADKNGDTPLHLAVSAGRWQCVRALVASGADVDECFADGDRRTPLMFVCSWAGTVPSAVVKCLISPSNINRVDMDGKTALQLALEAGADEDLEDLLIEHGADVRLYPREV